MISFLQCIIFEPISYSEFILAGKSKTLIKFLFFLDYQRPFILGDWDLSPHVFVSYFLTN